MSACFAASSSGGLWVGAAHSAHGRRAPHARPATGRSIDIRLRSSRPTASGQLTIEPSAEGGRGRLTALGLPEAQTQSRDARAYVVWANSEGRIVRLGELGRDRRGNGGLAFNHPAGFERYTVIVTAEQSADAAQPFGAPVLSTRAGEATAVFPAPAPPVAMPPVLPTQGGRNNVESLDRSAGASRLRRTTGDFYAEVDGALRLARRRSPHRTSKARRARRVRAGGARPRERRRAYVLVRFRDVPLPQARRGRYVMWAIQPSGRPRLIWAVCRPTMPSTMPNLHPRRRLHLGRLRPLRTRRAEQRPTRPSLPTSASSRPATPSTPSSKRRRRGASCAPASTRCQLSVVSCPLHVCGYSPRTSNAPAAPHKQLTADHRPRASRNPRPAQATPVRPADSNQVQ